MLGHWVNERSSTSGAEPAAVMGAPGLGAGERGLRGAEQHRVNVVEVPVGRLQQLSERGAERVGGSRGQPRGEVGGLVVAGFDPQVDGAAVQHRVVRAPDRGRVVLRHRSDRAAPPAAADPRRVDAELVQLVKGGLDHARRDLDRAAHRRGRRDQERERGRLELAALCDLLDDLGRRRLAGLEAQDRAVGLLAPGQLLEQILGPGERAPRPAGHREEVVVLELPAGVLRGQAGGGGLIDGDADPGQVRSPTVTGSGLDPAQAAHARGGEGEPGLHSTAGA